MLNLAQAIGMSPETYESNWPLFYKLYLAMNKNEGQHWKRLYKSAFTSILITHTLNINLDQKVTPKEAEDFFKTRAAKKGLTQDLKDTIVPAIVDSIKEDLPIVKFFEKMLEFEAKVRRAQDEQAAKISTPNN